MSGTRPAWREITDADTLVESICRLYDEFGDSHYDEVVTQTAHAVQAAELAVAAGADDSVVGAALLHDVGHLLLGEGEHRREVLERDLHHEDVAARFLSNWFGPELTEPVRLHVAAKRYLCALDDGYGAGLSPASLRSLEVQGGPMDAAEAADFAARPGMEAAVELRRWDDLAKDPDGATGPIRDFAPLLRRLAHIETPG